MRDRGVADCCRLLAADGWLAWLGWLAWRGLLALRNSDVLPQGGCVPGEAAPIARYGRKVVTLGYGSTAPGWLLYSLAVLLADLLAALLLAGWLLYIRGESLHV